jgi:hypothetical protein
MPEQSPLHISPKKMFRMLVFMFTCKKFEETVPEMFNFLYGPGIDISYL